MNTHKRIQTLSIAALLIAVGTVIPLFMPKIIIGPMSFTLASHVAVMIALFISPAVAYCCFFRNNFRFYDCWIPIRCCYACFKSCHLGSCWSNVY